MAPLVREFTVFEFQKCFVLSEINVYYWWPGTIQNLFGLFSDPEFSHQLNQFFSSIFQLEFLTPTFWHKIFSRTSPIFSIFRLEFPRLLSDPKIFLLLPVFLHWFSDFEFFKPTFWFKILRVSFPIWNFINDRIFHRLIQFFPFSEQNNFSQLFYDLKFYTDSNFFALIFRLIFQANFPIQNSITSCSHLVHFSIRIFDSSFSS